MKTKILINQLAAAIALTAGLAHSATLPNWGSRADDPNDWKAVTFLTQTGEEKLAWYHLPGGSCRLVGTRNPIRDWRRPVQTQEEAQNIDLFSIEQQYTREEDDANTTYQVTEFNTVLLPYKANFKFENKRSTPTAIMEIVASDPSIPFKQKWVVEVSSTDPKGYGQLRGGNHRWRVNPPQKEEPYQITPFSSLATIGKYCSNLEQARYTTNGLVTPDERVTQTLLPMELEISCARLALLLDVDEDNNLIENSAINTLYAAVKNEREEPYAYANRIRVIFSQAAQAELAKNPAQFPEASFTGFESLFLSYRMQNFGRGRADFVQKMMAAQGDALKKFIYKWRAFVRAELKDYVDVGSKEERQAYLNKFTEAEKYKGAIARTRKRTADALNDNNEFLKQMYQAAGMKSPEDLEAERRAQEEEKRSLGLEPPELQELTQLESQSYLTVRGELSKKYEASLSTQAAKALKDYVASWREVLKAKKDFQAKIGSLGDSAKKAQLTQRFTEEIEKGKKSLSFHVTFGMFRLPTRLPSMVMDVGKHLQEIKAITSELDQALAKQRAEEEKKTALTRALQKIFSLDKTYEKAATEAAVVEFLIKDEKPEFKDDIIKIADSADPADAKKREALVATWRPRAVEAIYRQLTIPKEELGKHKQDKELADFLAGRKIEEKNLLDYYCPKRPTAVPASGDAQQPALDQLRIMAREMGKVIEREKDLEKLKEEISKGFQTTPAVTAMDQRCNERKKQRALEDQTGTLDHGLTGGSIGPPTAPPTPKEDPNAWRDPITGAKVGIWAGLIGFIFGGPIGLAIAAVAGLGLGWWMSKEVNK